MDILPLISNKSVKIIKNSNNRTVICLKREITPGVYSKINVMKNSWYVVELCCTKIGQGNPGLWIATPNKKTLFYGNYFTDYSRGYLKRSFYTGNYDCLLVGVLVKNVINKSGFILEKLSINQVIQPDNNVIGENINIDSKKDESSSHTINKNLLDYNFLFNNNTNNSLGCDTKSKKHKNIL